MEDETAPAAVIPTTEHAPVMTQADKFADYIARQKGYEEKRETKRIRLAGHPYEVTDTTVKFATCDAYKESCGQIRKGDLLIMVRNDIKEPKSFIVLRSTGDTPAPLAAQNQQAAYEVGMKIKGSADQWTEVNLQRGAIACDVLGTIFLEPGNGNLIFGGDIDGHLSPYLYTVYSPDKPMLDILINGSADGADTFTLGSYRPTECACEDNEITCLPVRLNPADFLGQRTALFAQTRSGKTTIILRVADALVGKVPQLIFDIQGEYANGTAGFDGASLVSRHPSNCVVFAITPKAGTPSEMMKVNLYEMPEMALPFISSITRKTFGTKSHYAEGLFSADIPSIAVVKALPPGGERTRTMRKIQLLWTILYKAGLKANEGNLRKIGIGVSGCGFNPGFGGKLRTAIYSGMLPSAPDNLEALYREFLEVYRFYKVNPGHKLLDSDSGNPLLDEDMMAMLKFLVPSGNGSGPSMLRCVSPYHSAAAGDFISRMLAALDEGKTVVLDLSNAVQSLVEFFSEMAAKAVYDHQTDKNVSQALKPDEFVQLYFEEAHTIFPLKDDDIKGTYSNIAKMAGKLNIGLVYST